MKRQWILLANASHARLLSRDSATDPLVPLATLEHPESRLKASQFADDRPGHEATENSSGGDRYEPRSDVRRKEHQRFAREITHRLDAGLAADEFSTLWLFPVVQVRRLSIQCFCEVSATARSVRLPQR